MSVKKDNSIICAEGSAINVDFVEAVNYCWGRETIATIVDNTRSGMNAGSSNHETLVCNYESCKKAAVSEYPKLLKIFYKKHTGRELNLEHPKDFNEKIQWLKLYDSTPVKTQLADKYLARDWIEKRIGKGYVVPLLGVWDSFSDIDFNKLPNRFALKCTHGSGWNLIVTDKNEIDTEKEKKKFDRWMEINYAFRFGLELHYKNIVPRIIAEEYLESSKGIIDYRFFCFNGNPTQVWVDIYSGTPKHLRSIYDMDWNKIQMRCTWPDGGALLENKPVNFEEMNRISKILSKDFMFVRVDFFEINQKLYVGELTFTPMSGIGRFIPREWDRKLGDMLRINT